MMIEELSCLAGLCEDDAIPFGFKLQGEVLYGSFLSYLEG